MEEREDDALLAAARAGDRQALETLLERHQARVYRFGMKMCRDPHDAEDVLQDTLLAMARGVGDFRGASSISTWLYTIARSYCLKKRRKSKFAPSETRSLETDTPAEATLADPARGPDEALAGKQVERALEHAIAKLAPRYREVLVLRDVEGLTAVQVAEVLGLQVAAVKSRLYRARLRVRAQIAPLLGIVGRSADGQAGCPDVLALFSRHLENEISQEVCARMEEHLSGCTQCRSVCNSLKATLVLCKTTPQVRVPKALQDSVRVAVRDFLAEPP